MAVQQNKKSPSKRGMHRSHNAWTCPASPSSRPPAKPTCATTSAPPASTVAARCSRPSPKPDHRLPRPRPEATFAVASGLCFDGHRFRSPLRLRATSAITLAVDCMGGDHGPRVTLAGLPRVPRRHPEALAAAGRRAGRARRPSRTRARASLPASEVVAMDDPIEVALRKKKDSSMRVAIQQVKDGAAQAAVSAGNTGALMAIARYLLKTLDGIDRPAIATQLPNAQGRRHHGAGPGRQRRLRRRATCCSSPCWARRWCRR